MGDKDIVSKPLLGAVGNGTNGADPDLPHDRPTWSSKAERELWPVWPIVFIVTLWIVLLNLNKTLSILPKVPWFLSGPSKRIISHAASLDPVRQAVLKTTYHEAWLLGQLAGQLELASVDEGQASTHAADILHLAHPSPTSATASVPPAKITKDVILGIGHMLSDREASVGLLARVAGVFTFANIIWCCGAVGMAFALFPILMILARPLLPFLVQLGPIAMTVHYMLLPFYSIIPYTICLYIVTAAARYDESTAPLIALTGSALAMATYIAMGARQTLFFTKGFYQAAQGSFATWFPSSIYVFALALCTPLATVYRSSLLGFAAAAALYSALGFVVLPIGLGWRVGFNDKYTMLQCSLASGAITLAFLALKVLRLFAGPANIAGQDGGAGGARRAAAGGLAAWVSAVEGVTAPFRLGMCCFGAIALLLSGLIWSSFLYNGDKNSWRYAGMNGLFLAVTLGMTACGAVLSDGAFVNTGATFLVLWLVEKLVEVVTFDFWVYIFLGSGGLVWVGYFLKTHPLWVAAMFGLGELWDASGMNQGPMYGDESQHLLTMALQ